MKARKKIFLLSILILLSIIIGLMFYMSKPRVIRVGNYKYELDIEDKRATLLDYLGDGEAVIPASIGPFDVNVDYEVFSANENVKKIIYPNINIGNLTFFKSIGEKSETIGMLSGEEIKKRLGNFLNHEIGTPRNAFSFRSS